VFNTYLNLHIKLQRLGKKLRAWARAKVGNNSILLHAARQLIAILYVVQDFRMLSDEEVQLKRDLKARFLGLTAIEKLRVKQQSRLNYIRAAEANSKLFHLYLNGRCRKNHIQSLLTPDGLLHLHDDKELHIFQHFSSQFGPPMQRTITLDWNRLNLPRLELRPLEEAFTEEEVASVISDMASDKAPGPDGYIGAFFRSAWPVMKRCNGGGQFLLSAT
jgi:hypothetical protein